MIRSFRHAGLEKFFRTGSKAGIQPAHASKLQLQLVTLDNASTLADMQVPGWRFHRLKGDMDDHYSITVNANWRVTFTFSDGIADLVDYCDYH